ncbi:hypothetical protein [Xylanibacter caecicola]|uniref:hypothetical protein n=1 Tax=Xylanibacter caecicola TaxID=2736294 RepID=UPI00258BDF18|nr:hypothetical protein [Xylanibacter caecicola]
MKTIIFLIVLFLQIFCLKSIYAQGVYEKVTSIEQLDESDTYILVENKYRYAIGYIYNYKGTIENLNSNSNEDICTLENINSEEHPYEITIKKESNGAYSLHTNQGYIVYDEYTSILSKPSLSSSNIKNGTGTWCIEFTSGNGYTKIQNKSKDRMLSFYESSNTPYFGAYTTSNVYLFRKISADNPIKLQIGAAKYSTLYYSDKNLIVPDEVEAYTFNCNNEGLHISKTYKVMDIIPRGTAVVLHGQGSYNFLETVATGVTDHDNVLNGTDNNESIPDDDKDNYLYYMLSLNSSNDLNSVGFYWGTEGGGPFTNNAHKAYLKIPKSDTSHAKTSFLFSDIEKGTTAISRPIVNDITDTYYYTIQGNKISCPTNKGIYIRNGKKFVIK